MNFSASAASTELSAGTGNDAGVAIADAVCGAIFGAISHTPKDQNMVVEVHTISDRPKQVDMGRDNVIHYNPMPDDVKDYLDRFNLL